MAEQHPNADEQIPIALVPKHWVVVVAALEGLVAHATARIESLKRQGVDHTTLPDPVVTSLAAPLIVRGILLKELTKKGVMTAEANQKFGIDQIMDAIRKYRDNA
jgi:hypothetical protein